MGTSGVECGRISLNDGPLCTFDSPMLGKINVGGVITTIIQACGLFVVLF